MLVSLFGCTTAAAAFFFCSQAGMATRTHKYLILDNRYSTNGSGECGCALAYTQRAVALQRVSYNMCIVFIYW